ncbi:MAG: hypothetical protein AB7V01_00585 [Vicinamibacterales bacterium]
MPSSGDAGHLYRVAGLVIASTFRLDPLPPAAARAGAPDWRLSSARGRPEQDPAAWFRRWYDPDGRLWLSFGRLDQGFRLRFAHSAVFDVNPATRRIQVRREPGTPTRTLRHIFLNQVLPLLAASAERLVLHASAVAGPRGALAFVGPGGLGKSTLAGAMTRRGHRLLTDDALVLDRRDAGFAVRPTFPELRLWPDSSRALAAGRRLRTTRTAHYTTKQRVSNPGDTPFDTRPRPLARVYVMERTGRGSAPIHFEPLSPRDAVMALVRCAFVLDTGDRALMRGTFDQLTALARAVPVVRLRYPASLARLDELSDAVVSHARSRTTP